jgi:dihydroorotate dehydrogenase electron transfer subunit
VSDTRADWRQVTARVASQREHGFGHYWLDLEVPDEFGTPAPGQFVQILLGAGPCLLPRPMSVAGVREGKRRTLGFLYAPVGVGTLALAALGPGDEIEALGPLGRGFPLERPGTPVLVAGGRGVAPLLFAASRLGALGRKAEFVFGARDRKHLVAAEAAAATMKRLGGRLHLCTDDGSRGVRGTVLDVLARIAPKGPIVIHACGPHAMLKAVARWAMERGAEAWLAMESVMACGTGVCRGCPMPRSDHGRRAFSPGAPSLLGNREFAMCCTEGPVFESRELDWERIH